MLEKKESVFIFWPFWSKIEFTNIADVVQEWMTKYFDGAKLWNGKGSRYKTRNGVRYAEITEDGKTYKLDAAGYRIDDS